MKKTILMLSLILSAAISHATNFSLVIATTDTAYAHWFLSVNTVDTDIVHLANLGTRPVAPVYDSTNGNHSTWATSAAVWDSSSNSLQWNLQVHNTTSDSCKTILLQSLGLASANLNIPVNQWIMVQGNNFSTAWFGWTFPRTLLVVTTRPVLAFPAH